MLPISDDLLFQIINTSWASVDPALASWGRLKLGHGLPNASTTGINTVLTAIANELNWPHDRALTIEAVQSPLAYQVCIHGVHLIALAAWCISLRCMNKATLRIIQYNSCRGISNASIMGGVSSSSRVPRLTNDTMTCKHAIRTPHAPHA